MELVLLRSSLISMSADELTPIRAPQFIPWRSANRRKNQRRALYRFTKHRRLQGTGPLLLVAIICIIGLMFFYKDSPGGAIAHRDADLMRDAYKGDVIAQDRLASIYRKGLDHPINAAEAIKWYVMAARRGDADAQANLAEMYENGEGTPKDLSSAVA